MKSNTFITIKRLIKPTPQTLDLPQADEQLKVEPTQPLEIEQPAQLAPTVQLESLAEAALDESTLRCVNQLFKLQVKNLL